jgi:hypothetical protein
VWLTDIVPSEFLKLAEKLLKTELMENQGIRPEWVPTAYRREVKSKQKAILNVNNIKPALYDHKDIYISHSLKNRPIRSLRKSNLPNFSLLKNHH